MYKYTPDKELLRRLKTSKDKYSVACELFKDYTSRMVFMQYWSDVVYYSSTKVVYVPVNGYLFPSWMFEEVKVN